MFCFPTATEICLPTIMRLFYKSLKSNDQVSLCVSLTTSKRKSQQSSAPHPTILQRRSLTKSPAIVSYTSDNSDNSLVTLLLQSLQQLSATNMTILTILWQLSGYKVSSNRDLWRLSGDLLTSWRVLTALSGDQTLVLSRSTRHLAPST